LGALKEVYHETHVRKSPMLSGKKAKWKEVHTKRPGENLKGYEYWVTEHDESAWEGSKNSRHDSDQKIRGNKSGGAEISLGGQKRPTRDLWHSTYREWRGREMVSPSLGQFGDLKR